MEKGLKPNAIKVHRAVRATFPQITSIGGVRQDSIPDHPSGRALDLMIPNYKSASGKALGQKVALWAKANAESLGINYVIWDQHIWNIERGQRGLALHGRPRRRLGQPQEPRAHHRVRLTLAEPPDVGSVLPREPTPTNVFPGPPEVMRPQSSDADESQSLSVGSTCGIAFIRWRTSAKVA